MPGTSDGEGYGAEDRAGDGKLEDRCGREAVEDLMVVAGRVMLRSIADFTHRCETLIRAEQEKIAPDNFLIDVLCDAVRLCREMEDSHKDLLSNLRGSQKF
jgi:hypothetical protein